MNYTRQKPSPRYVQLIEQYRSMHYRGNPEKGMAPEKTFAGMSLPRHAVPIKALVARTGALTILDYGSGKGVQYLPLELAEDGVVKWSSIQEYWEVDSIRCYDPGFEPFAALPAGRFHGVVSTDMLEHCPEEDLEWIVAELFGYAERFVYANVACFPAVKLLPNGENAHCTVRPPEYWRALFDAAAARSPGVLWELRAAVIRDQRRLEVRSGNFDPADKALR